MESPGSNLHAGLEKWVDRFLRFDLAFAVLWLLISAIAIYGLTQLSFGNSLLSVFLEDPKSFADYRKWTQSMGGDSGDYVYVAGLESESFFNPEKLEALRRLTRAIPKLPGVRSANSFVNGLREPESVQQNARSVIGRLRARSQLLQGMKPTGRGQFELYWPVQPRLQAKVDFEQLRAELLRDERVRGQLLSQDGDIWAIVVRLQDNQKFSIFEQIRLREDLTNLVTAEGLGSGQLYLAGVVISQSWLFSEMLFGLAVICPMVLIAIAVAVICIFRRAIVLGVGVFIAIMATIWALAFCQLVFGQLNMIVIAAAPPVIIVISMSDFIHLTSAYFQALNDRANRDAAARKTLIEVGGACLTTSLTTLIGFGSLAVVPLPATRQFAVAAAVGVVSAFCLQSLGPFVFRRCMLTPPDVALGLSRTINRAIDGLVIGCRRLSRLFPWTIVLGSVGVVAAVAIALINARYSADFPLRFPKNSPLRESTRILNEQFSGSNHLELLVEFPEPIAITSETLRGIRQFADTCRQIPSIRAVQSVLQPFDLVNRAIGFETEDGLPPTSLAAEASLDLVRSRDPQAVDTFVSTERDRLRIFAQTTATDFLEIEKLSPQLHALGVESFPDARSIRVLGPAVMIGQAVKSSVRRQLQGNWLCVLAVSCVMSLALGSIRVGLLAQLPNLVPLAILMGGLWLSATTIDSDLLGLPMIALGIAVDDTIHFLHRFRLEQARGLSTEQALDRTFQFTGRAIVQSAAILCLGLLPCALSQYLAVWMIGTLLSATLACGLIADLLLVPAMIQLGFFGRGFAK